jgi:hypothetical protein
VRNPYDFFMVTFALLFRPSTTPLDSIFLGAEIVQDEFAIAYERAIFFMGSMRDRMVWRHHSSRNFPAQAGQLYSQSC